MYSLDFRFVIIKKGETVEAKLSKFILMMPKTQVKNQESNKFQESKSPSIKNQDSSEDSRKDSRYARTSRKASR